MDEKRKEELKDVILEETSRGRRHVDPEARRERTKRLEGARKLLAVATEVEFLAAMRAVGLRDGSPELSEALRIWRGYRS
jgi:hypothetical protein